MSTPVDWATVTYAPIAYCIDCDWQGPRAENPRTAAKRHARTNPDHTVYVDTIKRSEYSVRVCHAEVTE